MKKSCQTYFMNPRKLRSNRELDGNLYRAAHISKVHLWTCTADYYTNAPGSSNLPIHSLISALTAWSHNADLNRFPHSPAIEWRMEPNLILPAHDTKAAFQDSIERYKSISIPWIATWAVLCQDFLCDNIPSFSGEEYRFLPSSEICPVFF